MKKLRKIFVGWGMSYPKVVIFAALTAVVTAILLILPFLSNTSFENIGVSFECWVVFAIIVIMNCKKPLEAGIKVFLFFLISQPLIYLIEVPFVSLHWQIFMYYKTWFIWTLLCFPGGIIAWYVKKQNVLSALILSVATAFLTALGIYFLRTTITNPPKYLISALFCFLWAGLLNPILLHSNKNRIICAAVTILVGVPVGVFLAVW